MMCSQQRSLTQSSVDIPPLTPAYRNLLDELATSKYVVRNVYDHYVVNGGCPDKNYPTVVLRIDVDDAFHLSWPLALHLHQRGLTATHYFLTHPDRYYNLWVSDIPKKIVSLAQEVGLHSDHYYEQLAFGKDGLSELKSDISRLSELIESPVRGMVYHGHEQINLLGTTNWMLTKDILPYEIGLEYHDGLHSCYIQPNSNEWSPNCDFRISDYMGVPNSWGWNYFPAYPIRTLKRLSAPNTTFHIAIHTKNAFQYWKNWPKAFSELPKEKESVIDYYRKKFLIFSKLTLHRLGEFMPQQSRLLLKKLLHIN